MNFRESAVSCVCYHSRRRRTLIVFSDRFSSTGKASAPDDELFAGEREVFDMAIGAVRLTCIVPLRFVGGLTTL